MGNFNLKDETFLSDFQTLWLSFLKSQIHSLLSKHPEKTWENKGCEKIPLLLLRSCPLEGVSSSVKTTKKQNVKRWETQNKEKSCCSEYSEMKWWLNCLFLALVPKTMLLAK